MVESAVRRGQQLIDRFTISWVCRGASAHRDGRLLAVVLQLLGNALRNLHSRCGLGFRENEHELVPSISGRSINCAAMNLEDVCEPTERAASHKMTMGVIDLLQAVHIEQQERKGPPARPYLLISASSTSMSFR